MTTSTDCPGPDRLSGLLAGGLSEEEQAGLTAHLDGCARCRLELERLASGREAWAETARRLSAARLTPEPDAALRRVLADLGGVGGGGQTQTEPAVTDADDLAFLAPPAEPGHLGRLDHYEVHEVIGRGGMGVVLKAFDERLHRIVAIKVMAPQLAASASARQRFLREARAAAAVRNDHVINIYAVEGENALPYLVMEYIAGRSLQERIDRTGPLQLKEVLRIGMQTARGLAAAHAQGLIHRDIKPANILLENGVERVKITDFGLARARDDASLTQSGVVTGTPQYMAPEQARGETVDHRCDLFSLGSVLYAMCTGRPPFRASTPFGVIRLVSDTAPRPVRQINPEVSERLAEIIAKLHARDPADRFPSAAEVAAALEQHLAEVQQPGAANRGAEPTVPRPPRGHPTRWRRLTAAAAVVALLACGLGMTEATGVTQVVPTVLRVVRGDGTLVVEVDDPAVEVTVGGDGEEVVITGAGPRAIRLHPGRYQVRATRDGKPVPATQELVTITRGGRQVVKVSRETAGPVVAAGPAVQPLAVPPEPLPDWPAGAPLNERALVSRPARLQGARSWTLETTFHHSGVEAVAYSPDGRLLATGERSGVVRLWEADTGRLVRVLVLPSGWLNGLSWSADGKVLATACEEKAVRFWDVPSGRLLRTLRVPDALRVMAWSADGRALAACGWDHRIRLWDVGTGRLLEVLQEHGGHVRALAFSPDGKTLASGSADRTVRLWDAGSGRPLRTLAGHDGEVHGVAWSPDGTRLASGSYDHSVRVWDAASGECRHTLQGHKKEVWAVAWSPDGRTLASGSVDYTVRLWDPAAGQRLRMLEGHEHIVAALAWSPDGESLATGSWDTTVRLWQASTGRSRRTMPGIPAWAFNHARWSPDGRTLATGAVTVRLWEAATGRMRRALPAEAGIVRAWSPDSKILATTQWDHRVGLWDADTGQARRQLAGHEGPVHAVAWSPDGRFLASGSEDHTLRLWDASTGQPLDVFRWPGEERLRALAWSPDGKILFSGGTSKTPRVWDVAAGKLRQTPRQIPTGPAVALAVSPDGRTLASGGEGQVVQLWDASSGQLLRTLPKHSGMVHAIAWAPDGRTLASSGDWGEVRLWEPSSGRLLRTLKGPATPVIALTWSPDGRALAGGMENPNVWVWDAAAGRPRAFLVGLPDDRHLAVSTAGHYRCDPRTEGDLRYVVQTDRGQDTLGPEEFARKYGWKNDPAQVRPAGD